MKKTLAAVAVLGAFAGSALAADVTLYGKVDLGIGYTHSDVDALNAKKDMVNTKSDKWGLKSGQSSGSRFGIKGSEQIAEGVTVGFQLEQGLNADDGTDSDSTKAFSRESRLYVATNYGTLHMGRFGGLDSGTGSLDVAAGLSASGTGYAKINDQSRVFNTYSRFDNAIAYTSPEFGGVKVSAMVALGQSDYMKDGDLVEVAGDEATSDTNRYYGVAVEGQWEALGAGLIVSQLDRGSADAENKDLDDAVNVTAGVNYDFGVAKAYLAANYYDAGSDVDQYGVMASVDAPVAGGTVEAALGYKAIKDDVKGDKDTYLVGAFYKYPLSKRTYLYTGAGYEQTKNDKTDEESKMINVISGICHNF